MTRMMILFSCVVHRLRGLETSREIHWREKKEKKNSIETRVK
jgi:hypothetical protein